MTDPIADMLTRVRNALMVNKETVEIPSSNMKKAIADIMLAEGFISDVKLVEDGYNGKLVITLKYAGKKTARNQRFKEGFQARPPHLCGR